MPQMSPQFALPLMLALAGLAYTLVMGHLDPLRLAVAALTGGAAGLAVAPVLARAQGDR